MTSTPLLLAVDTAFEMCTAAVWQERALASRAEAMSRGHAERLVPMIAEVLAEASMSVPRLDALAVTTGPGAFTGVRIGLAAMRGMAMAGGLPIIGVTCFDVYAGGTAPVATDDVVLVALESKRDDIFVQVFNADGAIAAPSALSPSNLAESLPSTMTGQLHIVGTAAIRAADALGVAINEHAPPPPTAVDVARVAARKWGDGGAGYRAEMPAPLYLRPPDAVPTTGALRPTDAAANPRTP